MGVAPNNPVADWVVQPRGDHYGTFVNQVGGGDATVTRTTPKTIYDPTDGLIHDVPAGSLAVNPWSAYQTGGTGYAAVIEEARTNYLLNSYGAANNGNRWDGWGIYETCAGDITYSMAEGVYGNTAQRIQYTGVSGDVGRTIQHIHMLPPGGTLAAGESIAMSAYLLAPIGANGQRVRITATDDSAVTLGVVVGTVASSTGEWQRLTVNYATLPSGCTRAAAICETGFIDEGDTIDTTIDAVQLEKGAFPTSYIPTTTAAATRNADMVTVPTTGWDASKGTMVAVTKDVLGIQTRRVFAWEAAAGTAALNLQADTPLDGRFTTQQADGTYRRAILAPVADSAFVMAGRFNNGEDVAYFSSGAKATVVQGTGTVYTTIAAPSARAGIGNNANGDRPSVAIVARATVYDTALSDAQLQAADMTTDLLNGNASIVYEKNVGVVSSVKFMPRG